LRFASTARRSGRRTRLSEYRALGRAQAIPNLAFGDRQHDNHQALEPCSNSSEHSPLKEVH
jgi:hypothetical protein